MGASDQSPSIVVTGAGGGLGREVVAALLQKGVRVHGLGRGEIPVGFSAPWSRADLVCGDGVAAALAGADVVVHAASDPSHPQADIEAARQLGRLARQAGVSHIVHVQIAGVTDAAKTSAYYRAKLSAEQILRNGDVSCSVAAATQFHTLLDRILSVLSIWPILPWPHFTLQPVDVRFFAHRLADHAIGLASPGITVCGPQVLTSRELAAAWLEAKRRRRLVFPVPGFGPLKGFAHLKAVEGIAGGRSWRQWLDGATESSCADADP